MRLRWVLWLMVLAGLAVPCGPGALADSTINPALPANGLPYSAGVVRGQFDAAVADINGLLSMHSGATAPASPNTGELWLNTPSSGTTYTLNVWLGSASAWVPIARLDAAAGAWMPPVGGGTLPSIVSAATTNLGSVPQAALNITGSQSIASFGSSVPEGQLRFLVFTGSPTLVFNATYMILPGAANLVLTPGETAIALSLGSGRWRVGFGSLTGCGLFGSSASGCVPASGGGTTNYLRADGTWDAPPGIGCGNGTLNTLLKYTTDGTTCGDSATTDDGTTITHTEPVVINVPGTNFGSELLSNPDFVANDTGWTLGAADGDTVWSSGLFTTTCTICSDESVSIDFASVAGHTYHVHVDETITGDQLYTYFANNSAFSGPTPGPNQDFYFVADYTGTDTVYFDMYNYNSGAVKLTTGASIKEVTASTSPLTVFQLPSSDPAASSQVWAYKGALMMSGFTPPFAEVPSAASVVASDGTNLTVSTAIPTTVVGSLPMIVGDGTLADSDILGSGWKPTGTALIQPSGDFTIAAGGVVNVLLSNSGGTTFMLGTTTGGAIIADGGQDGGFSLTTQNSRNLSIAGQFASIINIGTQDALGSEAGSGQVTVKTGNGSTASSPNAINITAGDATAAGGPDGGNISITVGNKFGSGVQGALYLNHLVSVGAGTGKRFLCIDTSTKQVYEGSGVSCN